MSRQRRVFIFGPFIRVGPSLNFRTAEMACVKGNCLAPWIDDGDVVWFNREIEPRDGDLVVGSMSYWRFNPAMLGGAQEIQRRDAVKQLRIANGKRFLCAVDGSVSADAHEILGTVTAWYRPGWWRRPPVRKMRLEPGISRRCEGAMAECLNGPY